MGSLLDCLYRFCCDSPSIPELQQQQRRRRQHYHTHQQLHQQQQQQQNHHTIEEEFGNEYTQGLLIHNSLSQSSFSASPPSLLPTQLVASSRMDRGVGVVSEGGTLSPVNVNNSHNNNTTSSSSNTMTTATTTDNLAAIFRSNYDLNDVTNFRNRNNSNPSNNFDLLLTSPSPSPSPLATYYRGMSPSMNSTGGTSSPPNNNSQHHHHLVGERMNPTNHNNSHEPYPRSHSNINNDYDNDDEDNQGGINCCHPGGSRNSNINNISNISNSISNINMNINNNNNNNSNNTSGTSPFWNRSMSTGGSRYPTEAKQHVQSIHDFFRRIRDRWQDHTNSHNITVTSYDSFESVPTSVAAASMTPAAAASAANGRGSHDSDDYSTNHTNNHHHHNSFSTTDYTLHNSPTISACRSMKMNVKSINSPLRTASSYDGSRDIPTISPAEIVLPGSLLQQEMAQQMTASLKQEKYQRRKQRREQERQNEEKIATTTSSSTNVTTTATTLAMNHKNDGNMDGDDVDIGVDDDNDNDDIDGDDIDDDECVICMEGFDVTNPRMPTLCGCGENKTYFHLPCLYQWIEQSNQCPTCRKSLTWEEF